jgi:predicted aspartyl protease
MQINFKPVYGLIDTGAVATCMSESFAKYLKLRLSPSPDAFKLVSANRSPITAIGVVQADLSIQGLVVPCTFHVLKSLSHNVILGKDFLKSSGAIIDCENNCI